MGPRHNLTTKHSNREKFNTLISQFECLIVIQHMGHCVKLKKKTEKDYAP